MENIQFLLGAKVRVVVEVVVVIKDPCDDGNVLYLDASMSIS